MKAYALLAALTLVAPTESFAGHRHGGSGCGSYYSGYRGSYCPSYSYSRSYCYSRPAYYGYGYGYRPYYSSYVPAVSFAYVSAPRTYYRSAPAYSYDNGASLEVDVQRALKRRGYYSGGIDGDIGPASRAAIREYQAEHGLATTGRIDAALLRSMGI